jgi:hypothetical protein
MCKLVMDLESLREAARDERNASGIRVWVKEHSDLSGETIVTIFGKIRPDHWKRLLALTVEIENSER